MIPSTTSSASRTVEPRLAVGAVVRAEAIKFRSVRSNMVTVVAAGTVLVAFGMLFSSLAGGTQAGPPNAGQLTDSLSSAFGSINLVQLVLGVLGALFVATEYSTGLIRTTFSAVATRLPVLRAKVAVIGLSSLGVMTVASFVTFFAGQAVYNGTGATYSLSDPGVLRVVLGTAAYGAGIAVMGVALGFLLRSTAGAVATLIGALMIAPGLIGLLPSSISSAVTDYLPSNAGAAFTQLTGTSGGLAPLAGFVVFLTWIVALVGAAGWAIRHRDA